MIVKTEPALVEDRRQLTVSYGLAGLLIIMALMQLLKFEAFVQVLVNQGIGTQAAILVAVSLLTFEIFALPFLLRMWLSNFVRAVSIVCVLFVPIAWFVVALISIPSTIGFFGDFISLSYSSALVFILALALLSVWSFVLLKAVKTFHLR